MDGDLSTVFDEPEGATPLDQDEREGLKIPTIATRQELNAAEARNIAKGEAWAHRHQKKPNTLSPGSLCRLHKRMFGDVWVWAGKFRHSEKNIGVAPEQVPVELRRLLDDVSYWCDRKTFEPDEIAIRFHHRLTQIHAFPNGNGRHARLSTDLLVKKLGCPVFTWGGTRLEPKSLVRTDYIAALRHADNTYNYEPLITFARS